MNFFRADEQDLTDEYGKRTSLFGEPEPNRIATKDKSVVHHSATLPFFILNVATANCPSVSAQHVALPSILTRAPDVE